MKQLNTKKPEKENEIPGTELIIYHVQTLIIYHVCLPVLSREGQVLLITRYLGKATIIGSMKIKKLAPVARKWDKHVGPLHHFSKKASWFATSGPTKFAHWDARVINLNSPRRNTEGEEFAGLSYAPAVQSLIGICNGMHTWSTRKDGKICESSSFWRFKGSHVIIASVYASK